MTTAVRLRSKQIKVIIETAMLSAEEIKRVCTICQEVGVDFIKTSTGYQGGASVDAVKLIKETVKDSNIKIKASGGIRQAADAVALIEAGADRLGSSSAVAIIQAQK
jgi:deoxyribose-phosphate aldolase